MGMQDRAASIEGAAIGEKKPDSTEQYESHFGVDDDPLERIQSGLSALNGLVSLIAGDGLSYQMNNVLSSELVKLLRLVGREIEQGHRAKDSKK